MRIIGALAPLVTLIVAAVAYAALRQKDRADHRTAWWDRCAKAIDLMTAEDSKSMNAGMAMTNTLLDNKRVTQADRDMFDAAVQAIISDIIETSERDNRAAAKRRRFDRADGTDPAGQGAEGERPTRRKRFFPWQARA